MIKNKKKYKCPKGIKTENIWLALFNTKLG
jgi:hypothetical protein